MIKLLMTCFLSLGSFVAFSQTNQVIYDSLDVRISYTLMERLEESNDIQNEYYVLTIENLSTIKKSLHIQKELQYDAKPFTSDVFTLELNEKETISGNVNEGSNLRVFVSAKRAGSKKVLRDFNIKVVQL